MERTLHWSSRASSDTVSFTFTGLSHMTVHHLHHLYYHHLNLLLLVHSELKTSLFGKSFPPWNFSSHTDWFHEISDYLTLLFCSTDAWCVRLRRLLVDFRTHLKSMHFRPFISLRCSRSKQRLREIIAVICCINDCTVSPVLAIHLPTDVCLWH